MVVLALQLNGWARKRVGPVDLHRPRSVGASGSASFAGLAGLRAPAVRQLNTMLHAVILVSPGPFQ
jgi:hypothetical protein